jgi:predicted nucleic acid-binding protein
METMRSIELLSSLPLEVDLENTELAFSVVLSFARSEGLTVYDASHLELAWRKKVPIGTNDEPMAAAARKLGIEAP